MGTGLYVARSFKPRFGGPQEHAHQLATALTRRGERIIMAAEWNDTHQAREFDARAQYEIRRQRRVFTTSRNPARFAWAKVTVFRRTYELFKYVKPDYILGNTGTSTVQVVAMRLAARRLGGIPSIEVFHHIAPGPPENRRVAYAESSLRTAMRGADAVLCVSKYTRQDAIKQGVKPDKAFVAYNGLDLETIDAWREANSGALRRSAQSDRLPTIITVAHLVRYKGVQRVIEAMPYVRAHVPSARYVVVGDGEWRTELEGLARQSPARDAIELCGGLDDDDKWAAFADADLFVMPSSEEGFGVAYLEAAAFGIPSIGWNVMAVPEAIKHGETGLLVEPSQSRAELGRSIVSLLANPSWRRKLGRQARAHAEQFTWDEAASAVLDRVAALRAGTGVCR